MPAIGESQASPCAAASYAVAFAWDVVFDVSWKSSEEEACLILVTAKPFDAFMASCVPWGIDENRETAEFFLLEVV